MAQHHRANDKNNDKTPGDLSQGQRGGESHGLEDSMLDTMHMLVSGMSATESHP